MTLYIFLDLSSIFHCALVLVFYCCITNDHKLNDLKKHKFMILSFLWVTSLGTDPLVFCSASHQAEIKTQPSPDVMWGSALVQAHWWLSRWSSLQMQDWSPPFLAGCQSGTAVISERSLSGLCNVACSHRQFTVQMYSTARPAGDKSLLLRVTPTSFKDWPD